MPVPGSSGEDDLAASRACDKTGNADNRQPVHRHRPGRELPTGCLLGRRADSVRRELLQVEQHQDQRPVLLPHQPAAERRHLESQPGQVVHSPVRCQR